MADYLVPFSGRLKHDFNRPLNSQNHCSFSLPKRSGAEAPLKSGIRGYTPGTYVMRRAKRSVR